MAREATDAAAAAASDFAVSGSAEGGGGDDMSSFISQAGWTGPCARPSAYA